MTLKNRTLNDPASGVVCCRCGAKITGKFYVLQGKTIGPGCYETIQRRNRIRAQNALHVQNSIDFIETELCKSSCIDCQHLLSQRCPQEKAFKGILGRRR